MVASDDRDDGADQQRLRLRPLAAVGEEEHEDRPMIACGEEEHEPERRRDHALRGVEAVLARRLALGGLVEPLREGGFLCRAVRPRILERAEELARPTG